MQVGNAWFLKPVAEMSATEFSDWCQLLEARLGMVLTETRRTFLQVNLTARMRELGITSYADYYSKVLDGPSAAIEWEALFDKLTVQETQFFRHPPSYDFVARHLRKILRARTPSSPLTLWSLGCATGEETWSLGMLASEVLEEQEDKCGLALTATDISNAALKTARVGMYTSRRLKMVPQTLVEKYFTATTANQFVVNDSLKQRVCFARLNALELATAPLSGVDIIFCQNLLIYFRRWQRREILNQLARRLAPGGALVIGLGEITDWSHPSLKQVDNEQVLAFTRVG